MSLGRTSAQVALMLGLLTSSCNQEASQSRPDVLFISLDSVRADHLTFLDPKSSPHLAKLAERGTIFTQAISGTSWTLPSHLQMFTGLPPVLHSVQEDDVRLDPLMPTLPKLMRAGGYQSAGFFTCWYLAGEYGFEEGFDLYTNSMRGGEELDRALEEALASEADVEERRREFRRWKTTNQFINSPVVVEKASQAIDRVEDDEPLLLFAHLFDPHYDYIPPKPYATMFDPEYTGTMTGVNFWENPLIFDASKKPARQISDRDLQHIRALYQGEIAWTDEALGKLLAKLEERGRLENTLIIITADHGEEFFEHGDRGHRQSLYDEVLRVPLLIVPPRSATAKATPRCDAQVSLSDLLPTVLDYAELEPTTNIHGRSLRPAVEGQSLESQPVVSSLVLTLKDKQRGAGRAMYDSLRTPDQKLIRFWTQFENEAQPTMNSLEYFDLVQDPGELQPIRTLADKRVRQAWLALEREMDLIRDLNSRLQRTPASQLTTEINTIFVDDLAHLGYASVEVESAEDPSLRLGYMPLPPSSFSSGKRGE